MHVSLLLIPGVSLTLPVDGLSAWAAIIAGTFVSEDLTCITVGLLIRQGKLSALAGVSACFLGIYVSDLGLWLLGRVLGWRVLGLRWIASRLPTHRLKRLSDWFDLNGWSVVFAARFLPGTRLPLYVAAGMLGRSVARFAIWTFLAALVWTPLLVLSVAAVGQHITQPLGFVFGPGWPATIGAALTLFLVVRLALSLCTHEGRTRLAVRVQRLSSHEFWPAWLFYLPMVPYWLYLSLRYGGLTTATVSNPGIPHSGVVGESKFQILSRLPPEWIAPSALVPRGDPHARAEGLRCIVTERGWHFPVILKPDIGERGAGLRLAEGIESAAVYFADHPAEVIAQKYHPGPYEAGIFYYRFPGEGAGHIFSITDKQFPELIGDGKSTIEALIWKHPRCRLQAEVFLARHVGQLNRVPAAGERFRLAVAGNHCQGTVFRDGSHLITPELEQAIDSIAGTFEGFCVGRFDVRYSDVQAFRSGRDFVVVELNGVTSESTNIYDPAWSLLTAYRTVMHQSQLVFRIGDLNRRRGHRPTRLIELLRLMYSYYRHRRVALLAD